MLIAEIGVKTVKGALFGGVLGFFLFKRRSLKLHSIIYGSAFGLGMSWNNIYSYYKLLNNSDTGEYQYEYSKLSF